MSDLLRGGRVRAIAFDVYGTLIDLAPLAKVCAALDQDKAEAIATRWRHWQLQFSWLRALANQWQDFAMVTEESLTYACEEAGVSAQASAVAEACRRYLHLPAQNDATRVLTAARRLDVPLVVLTNGNADMVATSLKNAGLHTYFDRVLTADMVRSYKPDPAVYNLAARALGQPLGSIALVSSNAFDAAGGAAAGMLVYRLGLPGHPPIRLGRHEQIQTDWKGLIARLRT